jgi:hypothetical protein
MKKVQNAEKQVVDETEFKNLERQAMNSIDRMINNSLVNFMLISMFRNSTDIQKNDMIELFTLLRKDVTAVHKERAKISFELTDEQKTLYNESVDNTVNNAFKLIDNEVHIFKKIQEEGL